MAEAVTLESQPSLVVRKQPLLPKLAEEGGDRIRRSRRQSRLGEAAGECAAVCCCCPCTVIHIALLAMYRVPKTLWTKTKRKGLLWRKKERASLSPAKDGSDRKTHPAERVGAVEEEFLGDNDVVDWDKDMWEMFGGLGFFRSPSQRETPTATATTATTATVT